MNNETEQIFLVNSGANSTATALQKNDVMPGATQVNLENVQDFSTVCRTCATITEFVIPIFEGEGLQNNLADKIQKHLPIQVLENDPLPRVVCYQCASTLLAWHELVACCVQADAALQARLAQLRRTPSTVPLESEWSSSKNDQNKSHTCPYCRARLPTSQYKDHLVDAHAELLFHCQECDTYVDRKDFILHMSFHCIQYSRATRDDAKETKTEVKRTKVKIRINDENENAKPKKQIPIGYTKKDRGVAEAKPDKESNGNKEIGKTVGDTEENEFSDHSDADYEFGPLPESVFDAIEDSQDKAPCEPPSPDNYQKDSRPDPTSATDKQKPEVNTKIASHKKPRTCPICSKTYNASSSYFYHMKYFHRQSKEHACEVCGRKFGTRASLAEHATIHTGECRLECTHCGKMFRSKASLYIHSQTHTASGGSPCGVCGRVFRWRAALKRHVARHAGARAHACTVCSRAFSVRWDLIRHARTHERGEYACDHCKTTFAQQRYLRVHLLKKHGISKEKQKTNQTTDLPSVQTAG